jgi:hypothetical protein
LESAVTSFHPPECHPRPSGRDVKLVVAREAAAAKIACLETFDGIITKSRP